MEQQTSRSGAGLSREATARSRSGRRACTPPRRVLSVRRNAQLLRRREGGLYRKEVK